MLKTKLSAFNLQVSWKSTFEYIMNTGAEQAHRINGGACVESVEPSHGPLEVLGSLVSFGKARGPGVTVEHRVSKAWQQFSQRKHLFCFRRMSQRLRILPFNKCMPAYICKYIQYIYIYLCISEGVVGHSCVCHTISLWRLASEWAQ